MAESIQIDKSHKRPNRRYKKKEPQKDAVHQGDKPITEIPEAFCRAPRMIISDPRRQPSRRSGGRVTGTQRTQVRPRDAPALFQRFQDNRGLECMVCMCTIHYNNAVWCCTTCFKVFHLGCMHQWIKNQNRTQSGNKQLPSKLEWRCPGCQNEYSETSLPKYLCFCGRLENPPASREHPFSCGEPCSRKRSECEHPCVLECHQGGCPPCTVLLSKACCFCGAFPSDGSNVRCGDVRSAPYSCKSSCNKVLNCGRHLCAKECHESCEPCQEVMGSESCYCKSHSRQVVCGQSYRSGPFSCGTLSPELMDCGVHYEDRLCGNSNRECSLSPQKFGNLCACRKTYLTNALISRPRTSCSDAIATCEVKTEYKLEPCGHYVWLECGSTPRDVQCSELVVQFCRCSRTKRSVPCLKKMGEQFFLCNQPCRTLKTCLKCKCDVLCCPDLGRRDFGAESHICMSVCGKMLNCGKHKCDDIHHLGVCKKCCVISREPRSCNCGKTVLEPPFECGASMPVCPHVCNKLLACGHRDLSACHTDPNCAVCTILVSKPCAGGHETLDQIPCFAQNVSCNKKCGKILSCGYHMDKNACHSGNCQPCLNLCETKLTFCEHQCMRECSHASPSCDEEPCRATITVSCPCGLEREEALCKACISNPSPTPVKLLCTAQCAAAQRLAVLRQAFRPPDDDDNAREEMREKYAGELVALAEKIDRFVRLLDSTLCEAVEARTRTLHLAPTDSVKRYLTLEYVQIHYRFEAEVVNDGDGLHVVVHFSSGETRIPNPTLSQLLGMQPFETLQFTIDFAEDGPKIHLYDVARGFGKFTVERVNQVLKPWIGAYRTRRGDNFSLFINFFDANKAVAAFRKLRSVSGLEQCRLLNVTLFSDD